MHEISNILTSVDSDQPVQPPFKLTCADPEIFVRGGPGQPYKKSSDNGFFFFFFFFYSPQLILQKSNGQLHRNLSFIKVPEGVQHFPGGGGSTFSRGGQIAYSL